MAPIWTVRKRGRKKCILLFPIKYNTFCSTVGINESNVTGYVSVTIDGGKIEGYAEGFSLEPNIFAADCSAANCMGIHVHEGTSCVDADSQGGHYFFTDEDPW